MKRASIAGKFCALLTALALVLCATPSGLAMTTQIHGYKEGLALTSTGGSAPWGYSNVQGQVVVPLQYDSAQSFVLGVALVQLKGRMGLITHTGKYLIRPEYDSLIPIGYGLYIAQLGVHWGILSMVAFPDALGGETQELYPLSYDEVVQAQVSGLSVLNMTKDGVPTVVSISALPSIMAQRKVPSAQFSLVQGRTPSFTDVGPRDWHALWVDLAYNVGLMEGKGGGRFDPNGTLTVAEALKLAAFMESRAQGDDFHLQPPTGQPWYRASVAYCAASGIVEDGEFDSYERPITRAEMAKVFAATTMGRTMPAINDLIRVKKNLPDVAAGDYAANAIYNLYAKGVFTGTDGAMTFRSADRLTRAEAAAIVSRMVRPEQRITLWNTASRSVPPTDSAPPAAAQSI